MAEGDYTRTVYTLIRDHRYSECIDVLSRVLLNFGTSRPALSLLAYCYYNLPDYVKAADCYEQLTELCPEADAYRLYYAQALYKSSLLEEAINVATQIDNPEWEGKVLTLQAAIKYHQNDLNGAKILIEKSSASNQDKLINQGCVLYKGGQYEKALQNFAAADRASVSRPDLTYNVALSQYRLGDYKQVIKTLSSFVERSKAEHPELEVGSATEMDNMRSVGNSRVLSDTCLVEVFNLIAAAHYQMNRVELARVALTDMPPRSEQELDPVTLHNQALLNMDAQPTQGFEKLQFLLQQDPFPPETFANLLLLYIKYEYFDLAADVLAENPHLIQTYLSSFIYGFLEAVIVRLTDPADAYLKFDLLAVKLADSLRTKAKQVEEMRRKNDDKAVTKGIQEFEVTKSCYLPVLMQQAKIYWDLEDYTQVERVLRGSVEFCTDADVWRRNLAHVIFMQAKYKEALEFYEPLLNKYCNQIFDVSAIVLANLCVAYVLTSQNEKAKSLVEKIEKDEECMAYEQPDRKIYHRCIINLVIGTMYCALGNYDYGIIHIVTTFTPYERNLCTETWYYIKRCFLSLTENMAKHTTLLSDAFLANCEQFLVNCEFYGRNVQACGDVKPGSPESTEPGKNLVAYEARVLKALLLELIG